MHVVKLSDSFYSFPGKTYQAKNLKFLKKSKLISNSIPKVSSFIL